MIAIGLAGMTIASAVPAALPPPAGMSLLAARLFPAVAPMPAAQGARVTPQTSGELFPGQRVKQRSWALSVGAGTLDLDILRTRGARRDATVPASGAAKFGAWLLGTAYSLPVGESDAIRLGGTLRVARRRPLSTVDDGVWRHDSAVGLSLCWRHRDRLDVSAGWTGTVAGRTRSTLDRILSLAAGAPIAERGFRLDAATLLGGAGSRVRLAAGAAAVTLLPSDGLALGSAVHRDLRGTVSLGMRF